MEKTYPGRQDGREGGIFFFFFDPGKRDLFVTEFKNRGKLSSSKDGNFKLGSYCSDNSHGNVSNFVFGLPLLIIASMENENEAK